MKTINLCSVIFLVFLTGAVVFAHHAAEGIIDDEIWATIDDMVSDTPHGDLEFVMAVADTGLDTEDSSVIIGANIKSTVNEMETLVRDGLLSYVDMLEGAAEITIRYTDSEASDDTLLTATIRKVTVP